jgi:hypothetical protein
LRRSKSAERLSIATIPEGGRFAAAALEFSVIVGSQLENPPSGFRSRKIPEGGRLAVAAAEVSVIAGPHR